MTRQSHALLNRLAQSLPEGLIVDSGWMETHGYSTALRSQYVAAGWLKQPARRVYQRPRGALSWQQIVVSLQTLLARDLVVGGLSALELQGHAHYVRQAAAPIFIYGPAPPPTWLANLDGTRFTYRNDGKLFNEARVSIAPHRLDLPADAALQRPLGLTALTWGQWDWPIVISSPERAILELLDELPDDETFHHVDKIMEGLTTLSPTRMQGLLADCHNVKIKRLFFFFADRHAHAWLKRIDRNKISLGSGKRMLVKSGRYEARYMITVPRDLDDADI